MEYVLRPDGRKKAVERWRRLAASPETQQALKEYDAEFQRIEQERKKNPKKEETDAAKT